jgi:transcriptional regulator with XRE-family HTH domain
MSSNFYQIDLMMLSPQWSVDRNRGRIVSSRLKETRKLCGMTYSELAERIGEPADSIRRWERGGSPRDPVMIDELARALRASPSYLCGATDNPNARDSY